MLRSILVWFGFADPGDAPAHSSHDHHGSHGTKGHGHTHGVIDASISTSERGLWAVKWSFAILAATAALQFAVVLVSGSVALLADMIHNVGDAVTAIPLGIAFILARRKPSPRFTYGYGRAEDFAGVCVVLIILFSAIVAAYEAITRLIHPQPITQLGWVAVAGVIGFVGNEAVAVFRIRVGREINSAALIADGFHARTDGITSLAVVVGATGVRLGYPIADPVIGLLITIAIFGIVWQSSKAVLIRMLDGVEPDITAEIRHAAEHVPGIRQVLDVRARWIGHRLVAELDVALDPGVTLREADEVTTQFEGELLRHMPALSSARIRVRPHNPAEHGYQAKNPDDHDAHEGHHHHAPDPVHVQGELAEGQVEIVDTAGGERIRFTTSKSAPNLSAIIRINRGNGRLETLPLEIHPGNPKCFLSAIAPEEPHEFDAELDLNAGGRAERLSFHVSEPDGH